MRTEQELQSLCFNLNVLALQTEWSLHVLTWIWQAVRYYEWACAAEQGLACGFYN